MSDPHPSVSPARLAISDSLLTDSVRQGLFTHAAYGLAVAGAVVAVRAFGRATRETVFDLASLTKPLATATGALQLAERGALHLRQPISRFFEAEFGSLPHLADIEIRHLLTHTSGLPPIPRAADGAPAGGQTFSEGSSMGVRKSLIERVLATPPSRPPGSTFTYSDTGYILLGEIVAWVWGAPLDTVFAEGVAQPLGLTRTGFRPENSDVKDTPSLDIAPPLDTASAQNIAASSGITSALDIAPTGSAIPLGTVHDPRARELGGVAGHAGLFGTVADVLTFAEAIRKGGAPILAPVSSARMSASQIDPSLGGQSYGWFCTGNPLLPQGDLFSDRSFGHSGFTGTAILIDPARDVSLVLLTNRVVNESEDNTRFIQFRRLWMNTVAAALM